MSYKGLTNSQLQELNASLATLGGISVQQFSDLIDLPHLYKLVDKQLSHAITNMDFDDMALIDTLAIEDYKLFPTLLNHDTTLEWFNHINSLATGLEDVELQEQIYILLDRYSWQAWLGLLPEYAKEQDNYDTNQVVSLLGLLREYKDKVSTQSTEIDYNPDLKDTDSSPITYMKIREALHVLVLLWKQAPYINLVQVNHELNMQAGTIFPFDVDTILVIPSFTKDQYKVQFTTSTPTPELIKDYQALLHYIKQLETRYEE